MEGCKCTGSAKSSSGDEGVNMSELCHASGMLPKSRLQVAETIPRTESKVWMISEASTETLVGSTLPRRTRTGQDAQG